MGLAPQCHDVSQARGKMRSKTHHLWSVKAYVCVHVCVCVCVSIYMCEALVDHLPHRAG